MLTAFGKCHLHGNKLVEVAVLAVVGFNMLSRLYSFAHFLRTSGYFLRLVVATRLLVRERIAILPVCIHGSPPHDVVQHTVEVMTYLALHSYSVSQASQRHHYLGHLEAQSRLFELLSLLDV